MPCLEAYTPIVSSVSVVQPGHPDRMVESLAPDLKPNPSQKFVCLGKSRGNHGFHSEKESQGFKGSKVSGFADVP